MRDLNNSNVSLVGLIEHQVVCIFTDRQFSGGGGSSGAGG